MPRETHTSTSRRSYHEYGRLQRRRQRRAHRYHGSHLGGHEGVLAVRLRYKRAASQDAARTNYHFKSLK